MTAALHDTAEPAPPLEFHAEHSLAYRQQLALRDVMGALRLWRLCLTLAWLDIRLRYRGSVLGPFWLTLSTAAMIGSMGFLYATLFRIDLREYLTFLALSLVLWGFMSTLITEACTAYTAVEGNIRSIRMPYSLYAASNVVRNLVVLGHNLAVVVVVDLLLWFGPGWYGLLALPGMLVWLIDGFALGLLLGTLCARFRDIPPIIGSLMQMAFFISAVIWKPSQMGKLEWLLAFDPFYTVLEIVRAPLLGEVPSAAVYASALLTSVVLCGIAWAVFVRVRGRIAFWV
jgi:lipopolysaccharide transport system permease protein